MHQLHSASQHAYLNSTIVTPALALTVDAEAEGLDVFAAAQLLVDGRAQHARALAVDDARRSEDFPCRPLSRKLSSTGRSPRPTAMPRMSSSGWAAAFSSRTLPAMTFFAFVLRLVFEQVHLVRLRRHLHDARAAADSVPSLLMASTVAFVPSFKSSTVSPTRMAAGAGRAGPAVRFVALQLLLSASLRLLAQLRLLFIGARGRTRRSCACLRSCFSSS